MNRIPDWLIGGDPLRTVWTAGKDLIPLQDILWKPVGQWVDDSHHLTIESGTAKKGNIVALRLRGVIVETTRELSGELGWCVRENQIFEIPVVLPSKWSEPWRSWLYGEISSNELFNKLGLSAENFGVGAQTLRISPEHFSVSTRSQSKFHFLWLIAALGIGFAFGWLMRAGPRPSEGRLESLKMNSVESNSGNASDPEKSDQFPTPSDNHGVPPKSIPSAPTDR